jgi:hypothetical protein
VITEPFGPDHRLNGFRVLDLLGGVEVAPYSWGLLEVLVSCEDTIRSRYG